MKPLNSWTQFKFITTANAKRAIGAGAIILPVRIVGSVRNRMVTHILSIDKGPQYLVRGFR